MPALALSIPSPPERHDLLVRTRLAPVLRVWETARAPRLTWFERANKPEWGLRILATGDEDWLARDVEPALASAFDVAGGAARFIDAAARDKWTGGLEMSAALAGFLRADTHAALDALDADACGTLGSRAQFSLVVLEGLLDACELKGEPRLAFYRESFEWALDLGRWDRDVLDSLERTFETQRPTLEVVAAGGDAAWPSPVAARIGRSLLDAARAWARALDGARAERVRYATRGHSNRLGIHGGREAALRYLMWRARGGHALAPA